MEEKYLTQVVKSNEMVSSKYASSLLENQVMSVALSRIEAAYNGGVMELQAKLYPRELNKLISDPSHIYRDLKRLSKRITGHTIFIEDGKGNFKAFSLVPNAEYEDSVFTITFNKELSKHVFGLEGGFSIMELSVLSEFSKNSSFRIYELLKKDAYKIKEEYYDVEYRISELKFIIGLVDIDLVKNDISYMGTYIDWDYLYEKLDKKDRKYEDFKDMAKRVLKPAQEELEQVSDIKFEYEPIREGRSYKRIRFRIYKNTPSEEVLKKSEKLFSIDDEERQLSFPQDVDTYKPLYDKYIGHNSLTSGDIDIFLKDSKWNIEKVEEAIQLADKQHYINNYVGWIRSCIKDNYSSNNIEVLDGSHEDAVVVNEIKEELENNRNEIAAKVWAKSKQSEIFTDFEQYIETQGVTIEQLEALYSFAELNQAFIDYRFGRPMSIF